ncbi:MAG: cysteine--tRNA ligase [Candidatus Heimdallarchaeota archaeon]|nr:cysteine--tRNA ligase [Candidatus Heimdallarchaeota archaeon]
MRDEPLKIKLFNTLSRKKEELIPINGKSVSFYSCGQTVYEAVHVGNAKTYIVWDLLVRTLKHFGYDVKHVQNFTDVGHLTDDADSGQDKIAKKAEELKEHPMELVDREIFQYNEFMDQINVNRPNLAPRATAHITEMIDLVITLIDKNHGYVHEGSVYYDIETFPEYGKLAKLDLDNLRAGARIDVIKGKKNPGDFALWINAPKAHIMQYTSPWGKGYPGWHLECSVMAMKYLGETIDIHAGGIDHIPVHHTNEIAQSEGATGKKFANIWMHSEFITINGAKMSKSKKNFVPLEELIIEMGSGPARMTLMQFHYRTQADFSMKQARSIKKRYNRLIRNYHLGLQYLVSKNIELIRDSIEQESKIMINFNKALADDLNTPVAIAQINTNSNRIEQSIKNQDDEALVSLIKEFEIMMDVLGIPIVTILSQEIEQVTDLLKLRAELKKEGNLEASDQIRAYLQSNKYVIQDQPDGSANWYNATLS